MNSLEQGSGAPTSGPSPEKLAELAAELARLDGELFVAKIAHLEIPPGGILAIIVPSGEPLHAWEQSIVRIAEAFGIRVMALPHGTELAVVSEEQAAKPPPLPEPDVPSLYLNRGLGPEKAEER